MPIKAVEPQRLYRRIAEQIVQLIRRGEYRPGAAAATGARPRAHAAR